MTKVIFFSSIVVAQVAMAAPQLICTNRGDMSGSYILDLTGYEQILNGTQSSMNRALGFKYFRSIVEKVADLNCTKPGSLSVVPRTLLACSSSSISDDVKFEASLFQGPFGLLMSVQGPDIPTGYNVPCEIQE